MGTDPEIDAMSAVASALSSLDEETRGRVVRWAAERYRVTLGGPAGGGRGSRGVTSNGGNDTEVTDEEVAGEGPAYEHFAELFAKAEPKTDADKALVSAYWTQVHEGQVTWQSQTLNTQLKHLGHAISNITDALSKNMSKKPQRIIQIQKSGNSKQGRKTYKVTQEGLVYVQGMLSGGAS